MANNDQSHGSGTAGNPLARRAGEAEINGVVSSSGPQPRAFAYMWELSDFSTLTHMETISSPAFHGLPIGTTWRLKLFPSRMIDGERYCSVYLFVSEFGSYRKVDAEFHIFLMNEDGTPGHLLGENLRHGFHKHSDSWGLEDAISWTDLVPQMLETDDQMLIYCSVRILGEMGENLIHDNDGLSTGNETTANAVGLLSTDLGKLFREGILTDFSIITSGKTFMVHKAIVAARSTVFEAMFTSDMLESAHNSVEIPDYDDEVIKGMLEYIYTGSTDVMSGRAPELLEIGEKYNVSGLKEACEDKMAGYINVDNAASILSFAYTHNALRLKTQAVWFINRNKEEVLHTSSFKALIKKHANNGPFVDLFVLNP